MQIDDEIHRTMENKIKKWFPDVIILKNIVSCDKDLEF